MKKLSDFHPQSISTFGNFGVRRETGNLSATPFSHFALRPSQFEVVRIHPHTAGKAVSALRSATALHKACFPRVALRSTRLSPSHAFGLGCLDKNPSASPVRQEAAAGAVEKDCEENNFLMQFQADVLGVPVDRPVVNETTALGAAYLAGLAVGFWKDRSEIAAQWQIDKSFKVTLKPQAAADLYDGWKIAVKATIEYKRKN